MKKILRQEYTAEFKAASVKHAAEVGVAAVARELGLVEQTLRSWAKGARAGRLNASGARPITPEQMERSQLRAENVRLKMQVETLESRPCKMHQIRSQPEVA